MGRTGKSGRHPRIGTGLQHNACHLGDKGTASISEAGFIRTRRRVIREALVAAGMDGFTMGPGHCTGPLPSSWTDKHDAELGFQHQKEHRRKVVAAASINMKQKDDHQRNILQLLLRR